MSPPLTLLMEETAPGVWVALGNRAEWLGVRPHPHERASTGVLPAWRTEEFLASRALLRHVLRIVMPELAGAAVRNDRNGRPVLDGHPGTGISISHDGEALAVAVAPHRQVGVDVQIPPDTVSDGLLRRCLRARAPEVAALPESARATELAWVWTVQEACVKAEGTGLSGRPWAIDIEPAAARGRWGDYRWISLRTLSGTPLSCAFSGTGTYGEAV
ncbi:4'-phosphopantetheinyl transferase superfamily protein [Streptomyces sp. NPDC091212]|uniref:4'-phosphopantetheinyl transferase family protein n=1 Tax=Streptomyces sp. NPDC091212 TaxID=3155191 RepID=UPI0034198C58